MQSLVRNITVNKRDLGPLACKDTQLMSDFPLERIDIDNQNSAFLLRCVPVFSKPFSRTFFCLSDMRIRMYYIQILLNIEKIWRIRLRAL